MEAKKVLTILTVALVIVISQGSSAHAEDMGTAFTYQGRLLDANSEADGIYDFQFKLFDSNSNGIQAGSDVNIPDLDVIEGYFTAKLDFDDPNIFKGDARWLEIGARAGELNDPNSYTLLSPRLRITPTPYAMYAKSGTPGPQGEQGPIGPQGPAGPTLGIYDSLGLTSSGGRAAGDAGARTLYNLGNVGIGTASPADRLDVAGHINSSESYKLDGATILANTGSENIFVGQDAGENITSGSGNLAVGQAALRYNATGSNNSAVGYEAGRKARGSGNVFLGYRAGYNETGSNKLYIANSDANNLIYGEFDTGRVGINTTTPARNLHINDVMRLQPQATAPSDPEEGDIYMNGDTHKLMVYDGSAWQACW